MGNASSIPPPWTPEMDARLRVLVMTKSASAIGKLMGKTRNSIIGRAHRLGLKLSPTAVKARRSESGKRNRPKPPRPAVAPAPQVVAIPIEQLKAAVSVEDIGSRQCRWTGDLPALIRLDTPLYCGAPTAEGQSWCPTHRARVFQPRR